MVKYLAMAVAGMISVAANSQKLSVEENEKPDLGFVPVGVYQDNIISVSQVKKTLVIDFYDSIHAEKNNSEEVSLMEEVLVKKTLHFTQAVLSANTGKLWLFAKKSKNSAWLFGGIYDLKTGEFGGWKEVMKRKNPSNSVSGTFTYNLNPAGNSMLVTWIDGWKTITFDGVVLDEVFEQSDLFRFSLEDKKTDVYGDVLLDNSGNAYLFTQKGFEKPEFRLYKYQAEGKKFKYIDLNDKEYRILSMKLKHNVSGVPYAIALTNSKNDNEDDSLQTRGIWVLNLQSESIKHEVMTSSKHKPVLLPESFRMNDVKGTSLLRMVYPLSQGGFALHVEEVHE